MTKAKGSSKAIKNQKEEVAMSKLNANKNSKGVVTMNNKESVNVNFKELSENKGSLIGKAYQQVEQNLLERGEFRVVVKSILWGDFKYDRIGKLVVEIPNGMMEVKVWNQLEKRFIWEAFDGYDYDAFKGTWNRLRHGSNMLILPIKEVSGRPVVSLPKSKGKQEGAFYDVFKVRDIRFENGHSDNNYNLAAALTSFVQVLTGEFLQENPENRNGIYEHCGSCRYMEYLAIHDGVEEDFEGKLSQLVVEESRQFDMIPQWYCTVQRDFVDLTSGAVTEWNDAMQKDERRIWVEDEKGGYFKNLASNEVIIAGKVVKKFSVRKEATSHTCASCPFYHKNERKSDATINAAKVAAKEAGEGDYVQEYWTDRAVSSRMPVQTLVKEGERQKWVLGFPGEFEKPISFRIRGLGGINVYGTQKVMSAMDSNFVATMEEINTTSKEASRSIEIFYSSIKHFDELDEEDLEALLVLVNNPPKGMDKKMATRFNKAAEALANRFAEALM